MRLINVQTRKIKDFIGTRIPQYAILSHTWEEGEEVTYQDYIAKSRTAAKGYRKVDMTCRLAIQHGLSYAWVDTCCIDKTSSAELSEAINSMFRWYQNAQVCFVYLNDLEPDCWDHLGQCRWFTRGWTLQELIAPQRMFFLDSNWRPNVMGSTKANLVSILSEITNIDVHLLDGSRLLSSFSVAQKMSWAAMRRTTRVEDIAYSLLGIFDLSMPLLYGEEKKAFYRLQEAIMQSTPNLSILAWTSSPCPDLSNPDFPWGTDGRVQQYGPASNQIPEEPMLSGVLAASPSEFYGCWCCERCTSEDDIPSGFTISNIGIRIDSTAYMTPYGSQSQFLLLPLNCTAANGGQLGIRLRQVGSQHFVRNEPWMLFGWNHPPMDSIKYDRYLLTKVPTKDFVWSDDRYRSVRSTLRSLRTCAVDLSPSTEFGELSNPWPTSRFHREDQVFFVGRNKDRDLATVDFTWHHGSASLRCKIVTFGWASELRPAHFGIVSGEDVKKVNDIQVFVSRWEPHAMRLVAELNAAKIPRTLSLLRSLGDGTFVRFSLSPRFETNDQDVASESCYIVDCKVETYSDREVPRQPEVAKWSYG